MEGGKLFIFNFRKCSLVKIKEIFYENVILFVNFLKYINYKISEN